MLPFSSAETPRAMGLVLERSSLDALVFRKLLLEDLKGAQVDGVGRSISQDGGPQRLERASDAIMRKRCSHRACHAREGRCMAKQADISGRPYEGEEHVLAHQSSSSGYPYLREITAVSYAKMLWQQLGALTCKIHADYHDAALARLARIPAAKDKVGILSGRRTFVVGVRFGANDLDLDLGLEEVDWPLSKCRYKASDGARLQTATHLTPLQ